MDDLYRRPARIETDRSVLVVAESASALADASRAIDAVGARMLTMAAGSLASEIPADALLVELDGVDDAAIDRILALVDRRVRDEGIGAVVCFPLHRIDLVAARLDNPDIALLCSPNPAERSAALEIALARRPMRLNDIGAEPEAQRLMRLSEEVARIAKALAELSLAGPAPRTGGDQGTVQESRMHFAGEPAEPVEGATVRAAIRARRLREHFFPASLFADPAWDMLLDLMAARLERQQVAVSSLCIAAAVPATTALRWIRTLTDARLIVRQPDNSDGRRVFIALSEETADGMNRYFAAVARGGIGF